MPIFARVFTNTFTIMAKGNMFLGQSRGVVGDVVFYRQEGEQVARSRNRHPRNPRTYAQLYQRAILSTITAAYKSGRQIFDHSFEGLSVGAANQRHFSSVNTKLLRSLIAADINTPLPIDEQKGRVVGPGTYTPVGFDGMVISEGSYTQRLFNITKAADSDNDVLEISLPAAAAGVTTRAAYAAQVGLIADDYYTICGFMTPFESPAFQVQGARGVGSIQWKGSFFFIRLRVLSSFTSSEEALTGATMADIFEVDTISDHVSPVVFLSAAYNATIAVTDSFFTWGEDDDKPEIWAGVIRSRLDRDLRSDSVLYDGQLSSSQGILSQYILDAWRQGSEQVGDSELILEGGDF